jgi:hypothetical protein
MGRDAALAKRAPGFEGRMMRISKLIEPVPTFEPAVAGRKWL